MCSVHGQGISYHLTSFPPVKSYGYRLTVVTAVLVTVLVIVMRDGTSSVTVGVIVVDG